jgi:hypothetical protein
MARKRSQTRIVDDAGGTLAVATVADRPLTRMVGLLGRSGLAPGDGLVIRPCNAIHTWFMRFPIDVVFLDADGVVLRAVEALPPFRLASGGRRARVTIELPAGTLRRFAVAPGAHVRMAPA